MQVRAETLRTSFPRLGPKTALAFCLSAQPSQGALAARSALFSRDGLAGLYASRRRVLLFKVHIATAIGALHRNTPFA